MLLGLETVSDLRHELLSLKEEFFRTVGESSQNRVDFMLDQILSFVWSYSMLLDC